jgi:hypothetical protein
MIRVKRALINSDQSAESNDGETRGESDDSEKSEEIVAQREMGTLTVETTRPTLDNDGRTPTPPPPPPANELAHGATALAEGGRGCHGEARDGDGPTRPTTLAADPTRRPVGGVAIARGRCAAEVATVVATSPGSISSSTSSAELWSPSCASNDMRADTTAASLLRKLPRKPSLRLLPPPPPPMPSPSPPS